MCTKSIQCTNLENLFSELSDYYISGNYFFRGISKDIHYKPSLFREYNPNKRIKSVWDFEINLLENFSRYSIQYLPNITNPLDWVSSAQHYGLPTRLLDWTKNPFFAIYFSLFFENKNNSDNDRYKILIVNRNDHIYYDPVPIIKPLFSDYIIDSDNEFLKEYILLVRGISINSNKDLSIFTDEVRYKRHRNFIERLKSEKQHPEKLFFCQINHSNPRVVAQNGLFQIPRIYGVGNNKGNLKTRIINGCEKIISISPEIRQSALEKLKEMGINSISLFPDLQNICEYIRLTT